MSTPFHRGHNRGSESGGANAEGASDAPGPGGEDGLRPEPVPRPLGSSKTVFANPALFLTVEMGWGMLIGAPPSPRHRGSGGARSSGTPSISLPPASLVHVNTQGTDMDPSPVRKTMRKRRATGRTHAGRADTSDRSDRQGEMRGRGLGPLQPPLSPSPTVLSLGAGSW